MAGKFRIVDFDYNTVGSANTKWEALLLANTLDNKYVLRAVVHDDRLVAYKFTHGIFGAGHEVLTYEGETDIPKSVCHIARSEGLEQGKRAYKEWKANKAFY